MDFCVAALPLLRRRPLGPRRGSTDLASWFVSGPGQRAGGGDHAVAFLYPGFSSATVRRTPSLPWSLGGQCGRWSRLRSPLPLLAGVGGDGRLDACPTQGCCKVGGRSGLARSGIEGAVADWTFIASSSGVIVGRLLLSKAWWCSLLQVLRMLVFFLSGVAGGGGRQLGWWFSVAVVSVLCIRWYKPAYVFRIVLLVL